MKTKHCGSYACIVEKIEVNSLWQLTTNYYKVVTDVRALFSAVLIACVRNSCSTDVNNLL